MDNANKRVHSKYVGVSCRCDKQGKKTYYIRYKDRGHDIVRAVKAENEKQAFELRAAKLLQIAERDRNIDPSSMTISMLWTKFADAARGKLKSFKNDEYSYHRYLENQFGNCFPCDITTQMLDRFKTPLLYELKPATVRNIMELLHRIISCGVRQGFCDEPRNLVFNMPKFDNQKTEMFTEEQTDRYIAALNAEHNKEGATFLHILMLTGMRPSALCGLRWDDVDFDNQFINIRSDNAKNGSAAHIAMSDDVATLFNSLTRKTEWCFPGSSGGHKKGFRNIARRVKKAAGLPKDFRPQYMLRHNFASQLASSGKVDIYTIQRALTHKSITMTQRYAHLSDEAFRRAAEVAADLMKPTLSYPQPEVSSQTPPVQSAVLETTTPSPVLPMAEVTMPPMAQTVIKSHGPSVGLSVLKSQGNPTAPTELKSPVIPLPQPNVTPKTPTRRRTASKQKSCQSGQADLMHFIPL